MRDCFWGDVRQVVATKQQNLGPDQVLLEWKNEEDKVVVNFDIEFVVPDPIYKGELSKDFLRKSTNKINKLKDNFKIFQDDINKPNSEDEQNLSIEKLEMLIKYKEELLEKKYTTNLVKELMNLYQKIIEILSARNDGSFTVYLGKLHKMLQAKNVEDNLADDFSTQSTVKHKNTFRLSHDAFGLNESLDNGSDSTNLLNENGINK